MSSNHNHPPRCCCQPDPFNGRPEAACPACVLHGELTGLGDQDECPSCHQEAGRPHTDYCQRTTVVDTGTMFATVATTPPSHTRIAGEGPTPAEATRDIPPLDNTPPHPGQPCLCTTLTSEHCPIHA